MQTEFLFTYLPKMYVRMRIPKLVYFESKKLYMI